MEIGHYSVIKIKLSNLRLSVEFRINKYISFMEKCSLVSYNSFYEKLKPVIQEVLKLTTVVIKANTKVTAVEFDFPFLSNSESLHIIPPIRKKSNETSSESKLFEETFDSENLTKENLTKIKIFG
jgi:hypothetical protein